MCLLFTSLTETAFAKSDYSKFVVESDFPIDFTMKSLNEIIDKESINGGEPKDVTNIFMIFEASIKPEFVLYSNYSIEILDSVNYNQLYFGTERSNNSLIISGLRGNVQYYFCIKLHNASGTDIYKGQLIEVDGIIKLNVTEKVTKTNSENLTHFDDPEYVSNSDSGYDEIFSHLNVPAFIDESDARRAKHIERLQKYYNDLNIVGYKNADGTNTIYVYASPVKYIDKSGLVKDMVNDIKKGHSAFSNVGYEYFNDFGELQTYFTDQISNNRSVKVTRNSKQLDFGFILEENTQESFGVNTNGFFGLFGSDANTVSVKTQKRTQYIEYSAVDKEQSRILIEPTTNGVKQTIQIKEMSKNYIDIWVNTYGFSCKGSDDNASISFYENNVEYFSIGNAEIKVGSEIEGSSTDTYSINNPISIVSQDSEKAVLRLTFNNEEVEYLESPLDITVYLTAPSPTEVGYTNFQDRMVYSDSTTGNWNDPYLIVGQNGSKEAIAFMKFDLSGFTSISPVEITKAELKLYEGSGNSSSVNIYVKRVTASWNETSVTSAYLSNIDSNYTGNTLLSVSSSGTKSFDITKMTTDFLMSAKGMIGGQANYGFVIRSSSTSQQKHFASKDNGTINYKPKLVITYVDPTIVSVGSSTNGTISATTQQKWFKFVPTQTDTYSIYSTGSVDTYGSLYQGATSHLQSDDDNGSGTNFLIQRTFYANTTYYIRVRGYASTTSGSYSLKISRAFSDLLNNNLVGVNDELSTSDNFYICLKSLSNLLIQAGITNLYTDDGSSILVSGYFDDWYLYAIRNGTTYTYGLFKMREQESDVYDNNDPGITISFISFNNSVLVNCIIDSSTANRKLLYNEIDRVVHQTGQNHNTNIRNYFINPASQASYEISELYVNHLASFTQNGYITAPTNYVNVLNTISEITALLGNPYLSNEAYLALYNQRAELQRVPNGIALNNQRAGYSVYNTTNNRIYIGNPANLTSYEKYALLMTHTANVTFNSFAAEVLYHADVLTTWWINAPFVGAYESAIRADMAIGEEAESGYADQYYNLSGNLVMQQIQYHGEY